MQRGGQGFRRFFWMILGAVFIVGIISIKMVLAAVYSAEVKKGATEAEVIHGAHAARVAQQTDIDKLARNGAAFLLDRDYFYAAVSLKRAAELDTNYRDAAYGWAYATLQLNQNKLTPEVLTDINAGLAQAEKVDPYFEPMLRLKLMIAELENKQEVVSATEARMAILGLKN